MRLCLARVVTPRLTRAMSRPPYFRPYGAQAFTRAVSASVRISVPRFWRMYLALWLISRWRLPATPCLILPVAVSLKRFLTPLLVFSLGIFVSLPLGADAFEQPRQPLWPGRSVSCLRWKEAAPIGQRPRAGKPRLRDHPKRRRSISPGCLSRPAPSARGVAELNGCQQYICRGGGPRHVHLHIIGEVAVIEVES